MTPKKSVVAAKIPTKISSVTPEATSAKVAAMRVLPQGLRPWMKLQARVFL